MELWTEAHVRNYIRGYFCRKAQEPLSRIRLGIRRKGGWIELIDPAQYEKKYVKPITELIPGMYLLKMGEKMKLMRHDLMVHPRRVIFVDPEDIHVTFTGPREFYVYLGASYNDYTALA